jgi:alpha-tubulin suppressor-like RCC1 family protein
MDNRSAPALVVGGGDEGIDGLDAIDAVSAVVSGGDIYAWGNGAQGRLGIGSTMSLDMPSTPAIRPMGVTWAAIALGDDAAYAIDDGGGLWSWGLNDDGQLGTGDGMDQTSPTRVDTPSTSFVQVAGGNAAACAISTMDQLFCWGSSSDDRLPTSSSATPIAAGGSFDYVTLATGPDGSDRGGHHGCALSGDELFCWGENAAGELGLGDLTSRSTPTALPGAWSSVSTDGAATCAINDVGELWCWGSNTHGQLGQGNREDSLVPVRVCLEP